MQGDRISPPILCLSFSLFSLSFLSLSSLFALSLSLSLSLTLSLSVPLLLSLTLTPFPPPPLSQRAAVPARCLPLVARACARHLL